MLSSDSLIALSRRTGISNGRANYQSPIAIKNLLDMYDEPVTRRGH
jgi:hypothetical protein